jgi:hypothetical protein
MKRILMILLALSLATEAFSKSDTAPKTPFQSLAMTLFNALLPSETLGLDFTNDTGSLKALTDYGYVIVSANGFDPKANGEEVYFIVINPLSVDLQSMTINFFSSATKKQSLSYPVKLLSGDGQHFSAFLEGFGESDLKSIKVSIDFQTISYHLVKNKDNDD